MKRDLFITGTDTNVGKTVLSALLCASLNALYWKPIQTGAIESSDRQTVIQLAELESNRALPETYIFDPPVSPHLAARLSGTVINLDQISRPAVSDAIVIEGAGGVMVPINESSLMSHLMTKLGAPIVIAARSGLGTINHTLLTIEFLRSRRLEPMGVVLMGEENSENRHAIERFGNVPVIGWVPLLRVMNRAGLLDVFRKHFAHAYFE